MFLYSASVNVVASFLKYCELKGFRGFGEDSEYAMACFVRVASNYYADILTDELSVGVSICEPDTLDYINESGIYIVSGWKIIKRLDASPLDSYTMSEEEMIDMLHKIDCTQPVHTQFDENLDKLYRENPFAEKDICNNFERKKK